MDFAGEGSGRFSQVNSQHESQCDSGHASVQFELALRGSRGNAKA